MDELLNDLNPMQKEAVLHTEGPLLILAGSGSGKTRVITNRIAYLIKQGILPTDILAVTFTNKAAGEMRERVANLTQDFDPENGVFISTFHSMCARFLRDEAEHIGLIRTFSICDATDQKNLVKECIKEFRLDDKKFVPQIISGIISRAKDDMISADEFLAKAKAKGDVFGEAVGDIYQMYQKLLDDSGNLDFGDLQFKTVKMFEDHPKILEKYQDRFQYVMIDEYQDTNYAQYMLMKLLADKRKNICVVGDDDQSIYSWRGADIRNILEFEHDYTNTKVIKLEQNYRSTKNIVNTATILIARNKGRKKKVLWTEKEEGHPVRYWQTYDEHEEADRIAKEISRLVEEGHSLNDMAIFYRTNAQSRIFEEAFRRIGIPYVLIGSVKFYDRKEIKDVLAYLKVLVNPGDTINLKRIINVPARAIGVASINLLESLRKDGDTLFDILTNVSMEAYPDNVVSKRLVKNISKFHNLMIRLLENVNNYSATEICQTVLDETGYIESLKNDKDIASEARLENVQELISAIKDYEEMTGDITLEGFLEHAALVTGVDRVEDENDRVTLMTLHLAKGLEFPVVFMSGMEEGLFPNSRVDYDAAALEEERRLCYVGMTRAKEKLYCISAGQRKRYGFSKWNLPSRFIKEAGLGGAGVSAKFGSWKSRFENIETSSFDDVPVVDMDQDIDTFSANDRVRHPEFGPGIVKDVYGSGDRIMAVVQFRTGQPKRLLVKYANLEKVG